ncbi:MAG TPA: hypothetical protein VGQ17_11540 [Gemmatimonadales bacterium]|nr:hypothetical protein [Gemmatimonadales bacterium]
MGDKTLLLAEQFEQGVRLMQVRIPAGAVSGTERRKGLAVRDLRVPPLDAP